MFCHIADHLVIDQPLLRLTGIHQAPFADAVYHPRNNGKEQVICTADKANAYPVTVKNAMQGKKCFESFEAVLGKYTIGRTYNILPNGKRLYKMDKAVTITFSIPKELQAAGHGFEMICVTEKGVPIILKDQDKDPAPITISTDKFYAFALAYKDAKVKTK